MNKKLLYVSFASLPSSSANSIHIMKMCEALGEHTEVKLKTPYKINAENHQAIYDYYGVEQTFVISSGKIKSIIGPINTYIYSLINAVEAKLFRWKVITRNPIVGFMCILLRVNCIVELHDTLASTSRTMEKLYAKLDFFQSRFLTKVIVISNALKEYYVKQGCPDSKLLVLHDAVNEKVFSTRDGASNVSNRVVIDHTFEKNIGYVGAFSEGKGADTIVSIANHDTKNMYHLFGGESHQIEIIKEMSLRGNIICYGHIPNAEVPNVLKVMDVLVMPYKRRVSGRGNASDIGNWMSPMKMFEYMASGKPIVSSDLPVIKEVLKDNENAILVEPDSIEQWVKAIDMLVNDSALSKKISSRALADVAQFSWKRRAIKIMEVCNGL